MASFLITNAFWSAKTFFGYSASATSLISQNFRVLPSYLNEEQKETVSIETNALISQYNADIIQNEAYLNKLGVTNFKPIAGQIINEYDGTQDIFTMLINNENFKSLIKDSELSETDILRSAEAIEVILNDLIDIKLHGRYSTALYEFKKEFHQSNNFIASYNAFYNEAASRHQLSGKDYTLMMKFFINSLYQKSIATGSMQETYTLSRNIAGPALDDT